MTAGAELTAAGASLEPPTRPLAGASVADIEALYRARVETFVRFASAFLGDPELGRDAVQEAFARALRRRQAFRGDGTLEAWLWRAVVNAARNARRSRALRVTAPLDPETPGGDGLPGGDAGALRAAVARLPERQRACVFLRYFADLDYAAIAHALNVRPGTVAATLHAARRELRGYLEEGR